MRLDRPPTLAAFLAAAESFLVQHEAEHGLMLAVAAQPAPPDAYWALVRDGNDGAVVGAGLRNTSKLILSRESVPGAMALLAADAMQPQVDSVIGPRRSLNAFAAASGRAWRSGHQHRIYECRAVVPPASTAGSRRIAGPEDRELLVDWTQAFRSEALGELLTRDEAAGIADRHLGSGGMHVWTVDGEVVTCAAAVGPTPRGIRIGGVYTPPEHRRHGYASALVAEMTQLYLDAGREFVFLYADRDNPTSNGVYQRIGYRSVAEAVDLLLV